MDRHIAIAHQCGPRPTAGWILEVFSLSLRSPPNPLVDLRFTRQVQKPLEDDQGARQRSSVTVLYGPPQRGEAPLVVVRVPARQSRSAPVDDVRRVLAPGEQARALEPIAKRSQRLELRPRAGARPPSARAAGARRLPSAGAVVRRRPFESGDTPCMGGAALALLHWCAVRDVERRTSSCTQFLGTELTRTPRGQLLALGDAHRRLLPRPQHLQRRAVYPEVLGEAVQRLSVWPAVLDDDLAASCATQTHGQ